MTHYTNELVVVNRNHKTVIGTQETQLGKKERCINRGDEIVSENS